MGHVPLRPYLVIPTPIALVQVQSQIYLLDFQKVEGDPFGFMTFCAKVSSRSGSSPPALISSCLQVLWRH